MNQHNREVAEDNKILRQLIIDAYALNANEDIPYRHRISKLHVLVHNRLSMLHDKD